jgi:hypothetical protein
MWLCIVKDIYLDKRKYTLTQTQWVQHKASEKNTDNRIACSKQRNFDEDIWSIEPGSASHFAVI